MGGDDVPGSSFKRKKITLSVAFVTYKQLENLAKQRDVMVSDYVRKLVIQHLVDLGRPIYYDMDMEEKETEEAGQEQ